MYRAAIYNSSLILAKVTEGQCETKTGNQTGKAIRSGEAIFGFVTGKLMSPTLKLFKTFIDILYVL